MNATRRPSALMDGSRALECAGSPSSGTEAQVVRPRREVADVDVVVERRPAAQVRRGAGERHAVAVGAHVRIAGAAVRDRAAAGAVDQDDPPAGEVGAVDVVVAVAGRAGQVRAAGCEHHGGPVRADLRVAVRAGRGARRRAVDEGGGAGGEVAHVHVHRLAADPGHEVRRDAREGHATPRGVDAGVEGVVVRRRHAVGRDGDERVRAGHDVADEHLVRVSDPAQRASQCGRRAREGDDPPVGAGHVPASQPGAACAVDPRRRAQRLREVREPAERREPDLPRRAVRPRQAGRPLHVRRRRGQPPPTSAPPTSPSAV